MFDEPVDGRISLVGSNDLPKDVELAYEVKRITGAEETVLTGKARLTADSASVLAALPVEEGEKEFYLITWRLDGKTYRNHYFTNIIDIDYPTYLEALQKCGMDEFE